MSSPNAEDQSPINSPTGDVMSPLLAENDNIAVPIKNQIPTSQCNTEVVSSIIGNTSPSNSLQTKKRKRRVRLQSLDLLRGFIMIIMAWDHTKDFNCSYEGSSHDSSSQWAYGKLEMYGGNVGYFFARWVSHFCAPGFSYMMGIGMMLLTFSRRRKGWSSFRILRYFQIRGVVLIFFGFVVRCSWLVELINPTPEFHERHPIPSHIPFHFFQVMTCLGLQMMFCAYAIVLFEHLKSTPFSSLFNTKFKLPEFFNFGIFQVITISLAILAFIFSGIIIHYRQHGDPANIKEIVQTTPIGIVWTFLMVPGPFDKWKSDNMYPVIPWIGICLCGIAAGYELINNSTLAHFRHWVNSIIFFVLFVLVRLSFLDPGGIFNFRGWPLGEGREISGLISFFNVCKYPPSVAFTLLTLSVNSFLLFAFHHAASWSNPSNAESDTTKKTVSCNFIRASLRWILKPAIVFGRTPLIFYVVHFYWVQLIACVIYAFQGSTGHGGVPLLWIIPLWLFIVLPPLYPMCVKYGKFKNSTSPDSLWRLL